MKLPQSSARGKALARELAALSIAASVEPADLWAASRDSSPRAILWTKAAVAPHPPDVVAWPSSTAEVAAVVKLAAATRTPVVPFGEGGGVCGGAVPIQGGIALDLKRLSGPPSIDLDARTLDVQAGMNGARLEDLLAAAGATLGHFPSGMTSSTVGGWLAARSAGDRSTRYGTIADMVLSVEAVDGTGEVLRTLDGPTAGPDLTQLLVGSEGTLGVITSARLRIWPRPNRIWPRCVRFPSLQHGLRALRSILRAGLRPAVARLCDPLDSILSTRTGLRTPVPAPLRWIVEAGRQEALRVALKVPFVLNRLAEGLPKSSLLVLALEGDDCDEEGRAALGLCRGAGGEDLGAPPAERFLANRHRETFRAAPLFAAGAYVQTLDVATTWERVLPLYGAVRSAVESRAFVLAHFSHAYLEGCAVELTFVGLAGMSAAESAQASIDDREIDLELAQGRADACWNAALSAAAGEGATLGHHLGVGGEKRHFLQREHGEGLGQLRALKAAFDPHGILNPGKLLP